MQRIALLFALMVAILAAAVHPAEAATIGGGYDTASAHMVHGDHAAATDHSGSQGDQSDEGLDALLRALHGGERMGARRGR